MLFKLNCSDYPCGTGEDNFCNSISKEYFVHLNRIVSLGQLYVEKKTFTCCVSSISKLLQRDSRQTCSIDTSEEDLLKAMMHIRPRPIFYG